MSIKLTEEDKLERLEGFLKELDASIRNRKNFSFTSKLSQNKMTWCSNALAARGIMIEMGYVEVHTAIKSGYKWGKVAEDLELEIIAKNVLARIDSPKKNYLDSYQNDLDPGEDLGKPMTDEEEAKAKTKQAITIKPPPKNEITLAITTQPEAKPISRAIALDLDMLEWSIVKMGLQQLMGNNDDPLYQQLAERTFNKIDLMVWADKK